MVKWPLGQLYLSAITPLVYNSLLILVFHLIFTHSCKTLIYKCTNKIINSHYFFEIFFSCSTLLIRLVTIWHVLCYSIYYQTTQIYFSDFMKVFLSSATHLPTSKIPLSFLASAFSFQRVMNCLLIEESSHRLNRKKQTNKQYLSGHEMPRDFLLFLNKSMNL